MKLFNLVLTILLMCTTSSLSASNIKEKTLQNKRENFEKYQSSLGYNMIMNGAMCPERYERFIYSFSSNQATSLDESRKHIVTSIEKLLADINSDKSIASILIKSPLQPENITIYFYYENNSATPLDESRLSSVWYHKNNEIHYDFIIKSTGVKTSIIEPYDVAYEKVYGHKRP